MKSREEYKFEDVANFLHQNLTLIIRGSKCSEDRAHYIYDCFKETATPIMSIDYDLATKIYSVFYTVGGITTTKRVQFSNVPRVLESMPAISFKNVLVDITSLQHSVIMFIINILLTKIRVARLFLSYVKPLEYLNRTPYGKYEFYSKTFPAAMIPGMAARNKSNEVIVPFLGFDGDRLNNILEGMDYDEVCPIIGFPSDNPYWQFESLRNCMLVLKHTASEQKIRKCKANSVFDALQTLDGILTDHPSRNFVLIPLGTRPHSAACAIFASRCQNVRILYDYAQESPVCSRGVRSATIYNVSQYLI